jgi:nucleoside-diphosphate-sugar epimerase
MSRPGLIITGAAGFIGSHLLPALSQQGQIFALDCRLPPENLASMACWFQVDIGDFDALRHVFEQIKRLGGAEILLHLAGYYDFSGANRPDYFRTNVSGTRHLLELSASLNLKRFVFTSSVAACPFPEPGEVISEQTPPLAPTPYGRAKRSGEELLHAYQDRVPACIVRPAAIFSDWGEYALLSHFLKTWFSRRWDARLLAGRGLSAVPYLHWQDLNSFYLTVIAESDKLAPGEVLLASPNGCTTHLEIFREATRCFYGSARHSLGIPQPLARLGLRLRESRGWIGGQIPFERSWMADYIDLQLHVDASCTHQRLAWRPTPELSLLRRMAVIVEHLRHDPEEWSRRQEQWRSARTQGHR